MSPGTARKAIAVCARGVRAFLGAYGITTLVGHAIGPGAPFWVLFGPTVAVYLLLEVLAALDGRRLANFWE